MHSLTALAALLKPALDLGLGKKQCPAQAGSFSEHCLWFPHQDSLGQIAHSHSSTAELFVAKTASRSWHWTSSELSHKLSLTTSVQKVQGLHRAVPAHWKGYTHRSAVIHLQLTPPQHSTASMQYARPALGPQQAWRGRHILGQGQPFLPILSPTATGSQEDKIQYAEWGNSSAETGIQHCTGKASQFILSRMRATPRGHEGRRISAMKVLRTMASSRAAVNIMPHSCCALLQPF